MSALIARLPWHAPGGVAAVLFDLDGTLLDTVIDISAALNQALRAEQVGPIATAQVRRMIGRGVPTLIERALAYLGGAAGAGIDPQRLEQRYHEAYTRLQESGAEEASIYTGVTEGLQALHERGIAQAVVTNKPRAAAVGLLARRGLSRWLDIVVGGDSCEFRKPHPQPLLQACEALKVPTAQAVMVGDSQVDVLAARAAAVAVICVPYGYTEGVDPHTLACDAFIESVAELPDLLPR